MTRRPKSDNELPVLCIWISMIICVLVKKYPTPGPRRVGGTRGVLYWPGRGPPEVSWSLIGLVSFGSRHCGGGEAPSVLTRVTSYLDWIAENTRDFERQWIGLSFQLNRKITDIFSCAGIDTYWHWHWQHRYFRPSRWVKNVFNLLNLMKLLTENYRVYLSVFCHNLVTRCQSFSVEKYCEEFTYVYTWFAALQKQIYIQ